MCQVAALLLLSQQEERHLLERNVNAALQKKVEELQRNLIQVNSFRYYIFKVDDLFSSIFLFIDMWFVI